MNIYLVSPVAEHLEQMGLEVDASVLRLSSRMPVVSTLEAVMADLRRDRPHTLLVEVSGDDDLSLLEQLVVEQPDLNVVVLYENQNADFLLRAMRAGVREVLSLPLEAQAVSQTLERVHKRLSNQTKGPQTAEVWAFMPVRGGAGATFLAANLAYALASQHDRRVILIDLNLPFGEAELYVSTEVAHHCLADLTEKTNRLDEAMLNSVLVKVHPKLGVLVTGDQLERSVAITPEQIGAVIQLACKMADFVFIDVNPTLTGVSLAALDRATHIVPVLEASFPTVRNAKRMIDLFRRLGYAREKIRPLVNRYDGTGQITPDDIAKALDLKIWQVIPDRAEVAQSSVNQGVPVIELKPRDALSRQLIRLAAELNGEEKNAAAAKEAGGPGATEGGTSMVASLRASLGRFKR